MFEKFFTKYPDQKIEEKNSKEIIQKYKNKLPTELILFWQQYGFGIFLNGYLKIVNPNIYQDIFDEAYDNEENQVVIAVTGLGDILAWDKIGGWINIFYFRYGIVHK